MIGLLKGTIRNLRPAETILQAGGVGYLVSIPLSTYSQLREGTDAELLIHTHVREDQIRLFGFHSAAEKQVFELLLKITGIGTTMALSILSGISTAGFIDAVTAGRADLLVRIPGIGKTKAEKIIFELSRRDDFQRLSAADGGTPRSTAGNDAVEALIALGYDAQKSRKTVESILSDKPDISIEGIIREALIRL
jgi:holliday junction DNA helicase RuvA